MEALNFQESLTPQTRKFISHFWGLSAFYDTFFTRAVIVIHTEPVEFNP
jgi:hypothetical protein